MKNASASLKFLIHFCLLFFCLVFTTHAYDVASPSVPISDPVYDDLELLEACGLVPDYLAGHRPLMYSEVARLIQSADDRLRQKPVVVERCEQIIDLLKKRFSPPVSDETHYELALLNSVRSDTVFLNSSPRTYFGDRITGQTNPLVHYNGGRHLVDGFQSSLETEHFFKIYPYVAFYFQPRLQLQFYNAQASEEYQLFIQETYGTFSFLNTQIDVGRKTLIWGQSREGGFLFSSQARALDSIQLTNPTPWSIKFLGKLKYSFFLGTLGPEQALPYNLISGGKLSIKPFSIFEFGIARALIFGGQGSQDASFFDHFKEFFGARGADQLGSGSTNLSNSLNGFEWRLRLPFWRNSSVYGEMYFDDFAIRNLWTSVKNDTGLMFGFTMPYLDSKGSLSLRVEGRRTTPILYNHPVWTDGWTLNGDVLGDPLGADAEALYLSLTKIFHHEKTRLQWQFYLEHIDSDLYVDNLGQRFVSVYGTPEIRIRNVFSLNHELNKFFQGSLGLGYERVENFDFVDGQTQNGFLLQIGLKYLPRLVFSDHK